MRILFVGSPKVLPSEVFSGNLKHGDVAAMQRRALIASRLAARMLPSTSAEMGATAASGCRVLSELPKWQEMAAEMLKLEADDE